MASKMNLAAVIVGGSEIPYYNEVISQITEKVHELIDHAVKVDTINACEEFVRSVRYEHIVLIVTPDMINEIFAQNIHEIRHIQSIFLFDPNMIMPSHSVDKLKQLSYKVRIKFILATL
jgi:hypothetical protein